MSYFTTIYWLPRMLYHYGNVIMSAMASQIASLTVVYSTVCSGADQRRPQSSVSQAFVRGIHRWLANSPHKRQVTRKMLSSDDVIMTTYWLIESVKKLMSFTSSFVTHHLIKWFSNLTPPLKNKHFSILVVTSTEKFRDFEKMTN